MEESSQLENLISKEINSMSMQDLKNKVIKLAQAYRSERIRNDYFEKSLKNQENYQQLYYFFLIN